MTMRQEPFRIEPKLPPQAVKTYAIRAPHQTHSRRASCDEVGCRTQASGWQTFIDESTLEGQRRGYYIRRLSGRPFTESRNEHGVTVFKFAPGTSCFQEHLVPIDRPEFFIVRGGDWRGNPRGDVMQHDRPEHWVEDFATHQERIRNATR